MDEQDADSLTLQIEFEIDLCAGRIKCPDLKIDEWIHQSINTHMIRHPGYSLFAVYADELFVLHLEYYAEFRPEDCDPMPTESKVSRLESSGQAMAISGSFKIDLLKSDIMPDIILDLYRDQIEGWFLARHE